MMALSSQQPRFLNNLCAFVSCMSGKNAILPFIEASASFHPSPTGVPKITSNKRVLANFPGPQKIDIFGKVAQNFQPGSSRYFGAIVCW